MNRRVPSSLVVFHCPVEWPSTAGFWILAMGCSSMHSISTLLKRISSIERMIDIDDCLTMFKLCQFASMDIPFFSRPYLFGVLITFFRPLFVCFLYIHPTVASGRFSQLLERGRDHIRPTQEERWRRPSPQFVSKMAPIFLLSSVFSSSSPPPLATSLGLRWE